ncbi:glutamate-5-semialdehyde dehydrogenase [Clostridium argentinense CDC 2741]|uniref:Gamma-glutamyl phosphate reductase n=1 Tax=Clostridium argentinense CDC 2741 TaxID=1418104 RepID=A0A0C1U1I8_9CLOT|nr:glutamate-5-semialdehyde dehydrogenase [Clostridium argentinense]ARC86497.1 gamma-glutamyl-phosphate reductase [Clostridium argentinense]KIE46789.1 glutamate-5-semialdehyde dehydrogenase [Clostridium argentinense CDC 2741]NFF37960.1 glutamate-5-semialdehyde dehydrogenase [Clostridium argentinense]NFP49808.1 glutamate-5-semialdehyde dehydrogenase [Clostridium argentinense]NFP71352.1 glutamate-5-semialdehyde dehydrogenase [Clostridium argentinense]
MKELISKGKKAKEASYILSNISTNEKNKALNEMAKALLADSKNIIEANKIDIENARNKGISESMIDRLLLNEDRIKGMSGGLTQVARLEDPIGEVSSIVIRPNGLQIGKKRVPLGVIGIIYEARPNVTCDAVGLCLKSGNTTILRGGSEAINSNKKIVEVLKKALENTQLPVDCIQLIEDTSRETVKEMMKLNEYIDVLIPRGGAGLIKSVVENATVPVIETGTGNCHVYVDKNCDLEMAKEIVINAKTSRPAVCNSEEKLLVHEDVAKEFIPIIVEELRKRKVEVRGDKSSIEIVNDIILADEEDYYKEYLDYIICIKIVKDTDEAIAHINKYGSGHSEVIVTKDYNNSQKFHQRVDAAAVYVNASTRFTDGEEFGFGAEIGISTQKLHARGPMGLKELTTNKYIIFGNGQIR